MKKILTFFVAILVLVIVASANEGIAIYKDAPAECVAAVEEELPYIIKVAESMDITSIDSSQIEDDLSNVSLGGGYQSIYLSPDYLNDSNSGHDFYEAIDQTMRERRLFILYVNENPTTLITAAKDNEGKWFVERFGEDASEMVKALRAILRKDSEIYISGKLVFDRSGSTHRVVIAQEGKSDIIYKATDYIRHAKEYSSYLTEKVKERREELGIAEGEDWIGQVGGYNGDAPKFTAAPYIETQDNFIYWYIGIATLLLFVIGSFAAVCIKRKKL